ncbi:hypothetical protein BV22DRAFT_672178 [Leucogyrophana mollusca]|uniref:Uncharacterized protein n=1 Tax=Leucogyrophana mollusca TaxID=85980 RepID=A0ACB8BAB7_9AGAM|nr:hypothetical protein BV22DRAFT_672178 [Leucogyrophana mollusca]
MVFVLELASGRTSKNSVTFRICDGNRHSFSQNADSGAYVAPLSLHCGQLSIECIGCVLTSRNWAPLRKIMWSDTSSLTDILLIQILLSFLPRCASCYVGLEKASRAKIGANMDAD